MYKHCFLHLLLVFVIECCVKMHCSLPHNHPYCCSLLSRVCLLCLLICTCINSSPIACPPSSVVCWCLEIDRYMGFTDISVSAKTADIIGLNMSWQNAVIFLTHSDNMRKKAQRSKSRQLSYNNASRCGFINKPTRLTMERASAVTTETKASSGSFAILEATTCRCCVRINSRYTSGSFRSTKSLTGT